MTCEGCVGAVKRIIAKMDGVTESSVDLASQKVTVTGNVDEADVLARISKCGKDTELWK